MTQKTKLYATQALAASGFAVMTPIIAYRMRPDLWASGQDCAFDFKGSGLLIDGAFRVMAVIDGVGTFPVLTRSRDQLAQRVEWITGFKVERIEDEPAAQDIAPVNQISDTERRAQERLAQVKALASQEPPVHDCHMRKEILNARAELERLAA